MATVEQQPEVQYHPLDVTKLQKGQVFTHADLEPIIQLKWPDEWWGVKLMVLQEQIRKQRKRLGLPLLTMRTHKGMLIICDDPDAARYNSMMGKRGIRRFARASARNLAVDSTNLTVEEKAAHDRTIMRQAMLLGAIRSATHSQLSVDAPRRTTPRMVTGPA